MRSQSLVVCVFAVSVLPAFAFAQSPANPAVQLTVARPTYEVDYGSGITEGKADLALRMTSGCSAAKAVYFTWTVTNGDSQSQTNYSEVHDGPNFDETKTLEVVPGARYSAQLEVWCCPPEVDNCDSATGYYGIATAGPVSVAPFVRPVLLYQASGVKELSCLRPGATAQAHVMVDAAPNTKDRSESIELVVSGAGLGQRLALADFFSVDLPLTPTEAGSVEVYAVFQPEGLESGRRSIEVRDDCDSGSTTTGSDESAGSSNEGDGCSSVAGGPAFAPAAIALALLAMRRRRG